MQTETWTPLPDYPRTECRLVGGSLQVRDATTHVLYKPHRDGKGTLWYTLWLGGKEEQKLSETEMLALWAESGEYEDHYDPDAKNGAVATEEPVEESPEEPEVATEDEEVDEYASIRDKIATAVAAAQNAHLSQKELAEILGVSRYKIRKALKG